MKNKDIQNTLDALEEWNDVVGPKELEDNEVGLNDERYHKLVSNLKLMLKTEQN